MTLISGRATADATRALMRRTSCAEGHFRDQRGLWLSSIGVGTYLGEADDASDRQYTAAIVRALELGTNVIDTAINYRAQRSERAVGEALRQAIASGTVRREEV